MEADQIQKEDILKTKEKYPYLPFSCWLESQMMNEWHILARRIFMPLLKIFQ